MTELRKGKLVLGSGLGFSQGNFVAREYPKGMSDMTEKQKAATLNVLNLIDRIGMKEVGGRNIGGLNKQGRALRNDIMKPTKGILRGL